MIYQGPDAKDSIYLFHHHDHYDLIGSMKMFLGRSYFCETCLLGYNNLTDHKTCPNKVHVCYDCKSTLCDARGSDYLDKALWNQCNKCHRAFKTKKCFDMHIEIETCKNYWKCPKCDMFMSINNIPRDRHGEKNKTFVYR